MSGNWNKIGNISGRDGVGVPTGGARDDVLVKVGGSDFATGWSHLDYSQITGMVPAAALPPISSEPYVCDSEAEMLNLPAVPGRMCIRTDVNKTFILAEEPASVLGNWVEMVSTSDVTSVNSKVGAVVLTKADVGLGNADNTADSDKPTATTSVNGLMSKADKAKLDGSTAANTPSSLAQRTSTGGVAFRYVSLSDAPTDPGHATTKGYVDALGDTKVAQRPDLGTEDLNELEGTFVAVQGKSANITADLNYPLQSAGVLTQIQRQSLANMKYQTYMQYGPGANDPQDAERPYYWRTMYEGAWSPWFQVASTGYADAAAKNAAAKPQRGLDLLTSKRGSFVAQPEPGGLIRYGGNLDELRSYAETFIVEGFWVGSPSGGKLTAPNYQFVQNPVWRVEVRPDGLGWVTQRCTLLDCSPSYMVGFCWERVYNPATATWSKYNVCGGNTGAIAGTTGSSMNSSLNTATPDTPILAKVGGGFDLYYSASSNFQILREGNVVIAQGAFTTTVDVTGTEGNPFGGIPDSCRYLFCGTNSWSYSIQQGSNSGRWLFSLGDHQSTAPGPNSEYLGGKYLHISRYDKAQGSREWFPFKITWPAYSAGTSSAVVANA